jgi:adenylate cyclase class IV
MREELEVKAVVPDPDALRARLRGAGAVEHFRGRMSDRRYDRAGELALKDEVLRVRSYHEADGRVASILGWKGPAQRSPDGYKRRTEVELSVKGDARSPHALLSALGYDVVQAIDRDVDVYHLRGATVRLERYPQMDPLVEVEGPPAAIEQAIAATGIPRAEFTADPLAEFVRRFENRSGTTARLALP